MTPPRVRAFTLLGIETSCDETAAAVVRRNADGRGDILSDIVLSQISEHAAFGGVVPEIAARAHVEALDGAIRAALGDAKTRFADLDGVAVTAGPGLIGGLLVGVMTARAIAAAQNLPLLPLNHLEGHALTATLTDALAFPYLLLLVSGGHTQLVAVEGVGRYLQARDDDRRRARRSLRQDGEAPRPPLPRRAERRARRARKATRRGFPSRAR